MKIDSLGWSNVDVLDRICEAYGFSQKIQLANHFDIASSSLSNRYTRGAISYDFAAHCALETGANLRWLLTGEGRKFENEKPAEGTTNLSIQLFTISEGQLDDQGWITIDKTFFPDAISDPYIVEADGRFHFMESKNSLSDGTYLIDVDGSKSIRELTILPGQKLHVSGGKIAFECSISDIKIHNRVFAVYQEL